MRRQLLSVVTVVALWCAPLCGQNQDKFPPPPQGVPDPGAADVLISRLGQTALDGTLPLLARAAAIDAIGRFEDPGAAPHQLKALQPFLKNDYLAKLAYDDDAVVLLIHVARALETM